MMSCKHTRNGLSANATKLLTMANFLKVLNTSQLACVELRSICGVVK